MSSITQSSSCFIKHITFRPSHPRLLSSNVPMMMKNDGHVLKASSFESKLALSHTSKSHNNILKKPNSSTIEYVNGEEIGEPVPDLIPEKQRSAKIHDFCLGIPYGGIIFSGGVIGSIFSRNPASLMAGGLYGGALLVLSILSLQIWRQGHSSLPFILGQAGIAAVLLWKNVQTYSLTKKILPTGFHIVLSGAMLSFYTYVMLSGGNPPPKKLKSSAASQ